MEQPTKRRFVLADPSKCIGCSVCEYICALDKEKSFNPLRSRIRVARFYPLFNVAITCRLCEDARCVAVCPTKALKQTPENGIVLVNERLCDGCGWCIQACKYGAITLNPERRVVMICDLCGGDPKCIPLCPEEALDLATEDVAAQRTWTSAVEKLLSEAEKMAELAKARGLEALFGAVDERMERLEEKLVELGKKEVKYLSAPRGKG